MLLKIVLRLFKPMKNTDSDFSENLNQLKIICLGVPVVAQRKWIWLVSTRTYVLSLPSLRGLRIQHCSELWFVWRLLIWHLVWEPPYAMSVALKKKKDQKMYLLIMCKSNSNSCLRNNNYRWEELSAKDFCTRML